MCTFQYPEIPKLSINLKEHSYLFSAYISAALFCIDSGWLDFQVEDIWWARNSDAEDTHSPVNGNGPLKVWMCSMQN